MNLLKSRLREFKLVGILNSLEDRVAYANDNSLSYLQFLELLCEDEQNNRRDNSYKKRYAKAKFPAHKVEVNSLKVPIFPTPLSNPFCA